MKKNYRKIVKHFKSTNLYFVAGKKNKAEKRKKKTRNKV